MYHSRKSPVYFDGIIALLWYELRQESVSLSQNFDELKITSTNCWPVSNIWFQANK